MEPEDLLKRVGNCLDEGLSQSKNHASSIHAVGISYVSGMPLWAQTRPVNP